MGNSWTSPMAQPFHTYICRCRHDIMCGSVDMILWTVGCMNIKLIVHWAELMLGGTRWLTLSDVHIGIYGHMFGLCWSLFWLCLKRVRGWLLNRQAESALCLCLSMRWVMIFLWGFNRMQLEYQLGRRGLAFLVNNFGDLFILKVKSKSHKCLKTMTLNINKCKDIIIHTKTSTSSKFFFF